MHDLEPYFKWRQYYIASEDEQSPFYQRSYDEFKYSQKIYNYYIHPQWDSFGSQTLYCKALFVDYEIGVAMIEMFGEWNDSLYNDIMYFKQHVVNPLINGGVNKFILFCDNVLNYHGDDNSYYEEWSEEIEEGFICICNTLEHVTKEMERYQLQYYVHVGDRYESVDWRRKLPPQVLEEIHLISNQRTKQLDY